MKLFKFGKKEKVIVLALLALALLLLPSVVRSKYIISVIVTCFLYACFGMSWNILGGYGGQISWCHAAFASIGALQRSSSISASICRHWSVCQLAYSCPAYLQRSSVR